MQKKKRRPDAGVARFCIGIGIFCLVAGIFFEPDLSRKCFAGATAIMALSYGTKELAAAKKWKQESENEPNESIKNITAKVESDDSISCKLCVACEETIPE